MVYETVESKQMPLKESFALKNFSFSHEEVITIFCQATCALEEVKKVLNPYTTACTK